MIDVIIGFEELLYEVDENDGTVNITVVIVNNNLRQSAEVIFSSVDGRALSTPPMDYENLGDIPLRFNQTTSHQSVIIPIIDDNILEDVENFLGQLTTLETFVDLMPAMTEINILEVNDSKYLATYVAKVNALKLMWTPLNQDIRTPEI